MSSTSLHKVNVKRLLQNKGVSYSGFDLACDFSSKVLENKTTDAQISCYTRKCVHQSDATTMLDLIRFLDNSKSVEDYNGIVDSKGCSLISIAAALGDNTMIMVLFSHTNIDIDMRNLEGFTAVSIAAYYGRLETVKLLSSLGADLSIRNTQGETPLIVAARHACIVEDEEIYNQIFLVMQYLFNRLPRNKKGELTTETISELRETKHIDKRIKCILGNWIKDHAKCRELWIPKYESFRQEQNVNSILNDQFHCRRKEIRYWPWVKIAVFLIFVLYDLMLQGITTNLLVYLGLYFLAYFV